MSRTRLLILTVGCFVLNANAADPPKRRPAQSSPTTASRLPDEVLDEVFVEGHRITEPRKLIAWIDRLVGQFSYEGYVERYNSDGTVERAEAQGGSQCFRFFKAVAVQCQVNVGWQPMPGAPGTRALGGESRLAPAVVVYSLNHEKSYFGHMQVDSDGVASSGRGWLVDDTLISKDPCADFANCVRVLRLQAPPDAKVVHMRVDLEQNGKLQSRQDFQWKRMPSAVAQPAVDSTIIPAASAPDARASELARVPPNIEAWLRQLPGQFRLPSLDSGSCWKMQGELAARPASDAKREPLNCPKSNDEASTAKNRPADAECQGIGTGPGMRCVMYMPWPESGLPLNRKWYMTLNSLFWMYGYDPLTRGIALVSVFPGASAGPAAFTVGQLKDGRLNYMSDCGRPPCNAVEQITIAPGGERVLWQVAQATGQPAFMSWQMDRVQEQSAAAAQMAPAIRRSNLSPRRR